MRLHRTKKALWQSWPYNKHNRSTAMQHGDVAPNTGGVHVGYLDGWRGLAILLVLQAHFFPTQYLDSGRFGVDVFFALSGLLMAQILFERRMPLGTFYQRRASRILPAFLVFVCLVYGVSRLRGGEHSWSQMLATLTFLRSYFPVSPGIWDSGLPIGHLWSLNVEEHAYLLMSLLTLAVAGRRAGLALIALGFASFAVQIVYLRWWAPVGWRQHTEVMIPGIVLAAGYTLLRLHRVPRWAPLIAFVIAALCYAHILSWMAYAFLAPIALAFVVNHLQDTPALARRILEWQPLRLLGVWSFSIYLWQQPFHELKTVPLWLAGVLAVATGLVSYYIIENPARAWLNSLGVHPNIQTPAAKSTAPTV
jgi:peptidoglycan/LPS O-acetylase OafA/YrhL